VKILNHRSFQFLFLQMEIPIRLKLFLFLINIRLDLKVSLNQVIWPHSLMPFQSLERKKVEWSQLLEEIKERLNFLKPTKMEKS